MNKYMYAYRMKSFLISHMYVVGDFEISEKHAKNCTAH